MVFQYIYAMLNSLNTLNSASPFEDGGAGDKNDSLLPEERIYNIRLARLHISQLWLDAETKFLYFKTDKSSAPGTAFPYFNSNFSGE